MNLLKFLKINLWEPKKEKWLSVSEILGKTNYFATLEEKNLVRRRLSHITQIQFTEQTLNKKGEKYP
jgi:hypothetical protein